MNPTHDVLYRIHQIQATRRGRTPLAYEQFSARRPDTYETDLTGLLGPATDASAAGASVGPAPFALGEVYLTPNAAGALPRDDVLRAVERHAAGDWRQLDEQDRQENERALQTRGRLLSVYEASNGHRFYILTDPDWGHTNVEFHICLHPPAIREYDQQRMAGSALRVSAARGQRPASPTRLDFVAALTTRSKSSIRTYTKFGLSEGGTTLAGQLAALLANGPQTHFGFEKEKRRRLGVMSRGRHTCLFPLDQPWCE